MLRGETRGLGPFQGWERTGPYHQLGSRPAGMVAGGPGTMGGSLDGVNGASVIDRHGPQPWHPDNPLFWFGLLAAVTFGFIGASTHVRVGKVRAGVTAGDT